MLSAKSIKNLLQYITSNILLESKKRKTKNWEDNDYYDSDDDTFLDRTGTVEKKRQLRMEQAGIKTNKEVHTYKTLVNNKLYFL